MSQRRACGRAGLAALVVLLGLIFAGESRSHALAPALLELTEREGGAIDVRFKTSRLRPLGGAPLRPVLPAHCTQSGEPRAKVEGQAFIEEFRSVCAPPSLVGSTLGVEGLAENGIDALLRIELADGRQIGRVLRAGAPDLQVPAKPSRFDVAVSYASLGALHIASGPDHLLFVFGLVLLVAAARQLVFTVTAFSLGHSVTLSIAALGFVAFPTGPVEVLIAASVLVLAVELAADGLGGRAAARPARPRFTAGMALLFGLLHGLGFAGALSEAGLPAGEIPLALVAFNVGIEIGQIAFIASIAALGAVAGRLFARPAPRVPSRVRVAAVLGMGTLAAFWCIDRAALLLG